MVRAAWAADVSGAHAYLTGDGSSDIVQVWVDGSLLRHSASGPGFASGTDFNSTAGVIETVPTNGATQLHIDGGGENDLVSIGISGSPWTSIHTLFEIQGGAGEDLALLAGPDETAPLTASLTADRITAGVGTVDYYGVEALVPELGAGPDTVNVLSTRLHTTVEVDGSGGDDTANVGSIGNLKGAFTLDGEGGTDRLVYTDAQTPGFPYLISSGTITRDGGAPVRAAKPAARVRISRLRRSSRRLRPPTRRPPALPSASPRASS